MPTTAFTAIGIAHLCTSWREESWVNQSETVSRAFDHFLWKAYQVIRWDQGPDAYYVHMYHTFDDAGNRHIFRRIDYVHALYTFMMRLTTTNIEQLNDDYDVLKLALNELEPFMAPERGDPIPVECVMTDGLVYMNGHR